MMSASTLGITKSSHCDHHLQSLNAIAVVAIFAHEANP